MRVEDYFDPKFSNDGPNFMIGVLRTLGLTTKEELEDFKKQREDRDD